MPCCRCRKCGARKSLRMDPQHYRYHQPKCPRGSCKARDWRVDTYRQRVERGPQSKPCRCGEYIGRCGNPMPHRRGSGWCVHNPRITDEDRQERWESGRLYRLH